MSRKNLLKTLVDMHTYCRPMGSRTERQFIDRYISNLPRAERDEFGNWHVTVDDAPVLWSCHTDTVHSKSGRQEVHLNRKTGNLALSKFSNSSCLGADDTAGVFLCREMILAKVPGHYVFHYGEERGGIGSGELAATYPSFLSMFKFAIALDRQGHSDVITFQSGGRTASDAFAKSLSAQLGGYYEPCAMGLYTDTSEYSEIIPECSNVSIGYSRAHSYMESLDTRHVLRLLDALKKIDVSKLVCERDPSKYESQWGSWSSESKQTTVMVYDDGRDFIEAESYQRYSEDPRWDSLLKEDDVITGNDPNTRLDYYLDPIFADAQRELTRQLQMRKTH